MRAELDMAGRHLVTALRRDGAVEIALEHSEGDRRSIAHEALARQLRVVHGGARHRLDTETSRVVLAAAQGACEIVVEDETAVPLSLVTLELGASIAEVPGAPRYRLSPFELRYAADTGRIHPVPLAARAKTSWRPATDLHTHFAGCVAAEALVALGVEHGIAYPRALLEEAGLHAESGGDAVPLAALSAHLRARLAQRLEVPLDRRVTFLEMERIYRLRSPITKAAATFVPLCRRIAADYARMGVRYVELSLGSVVEARTLRAIHAEVPRIEAEMGVTLRFLAAISRHDDPEWDLDLVERIKTLAGSVYVAGVDFMGHETNSTRAFAPLLESIAAWADAARAGFVVRVHAGESPAHPENVRLALDAVRGRAVELRIGHGLYGVDDETLAELARAGATVEFNLDSNIALNHLQGARSVPLRRYVEAGAAVVLGSDGYGIYQTSPAAAVQAALLAGLAPEHVDGALAAAERALVERARGRDAALVRTAARFVVPDDPPPVFFTPAVIERRRSARAARDAAIERRLKELALPQIARGDLALLAGGRMVVSIAGSWARTWEAMSESERMLAERELEAFADGLSPSEVVLLTGGTRHGVEGVLGRAAVRRGLTVVAALVRATPPDGIDREVATHACFVAEDLYEKAAGLYSLVAEHAGACLFVGGGQIVSDEIQTAKNLRLRYLLMEGVGGASARHAAERPERAFRHAHEALAALRAWRTAATETAPHWFEGPNPTVDAVVVRERGGVREVLLVLRDHDAPAEPGKWALPGGFVASAAARGGRWVGAESDAAACVRELAEETGLEIDARGLVPIGVFEGDGRDPRDSPRSWSRSTAFLVDLGTTALAVAGGDDAADARWFPLDALPAAVGFDHARIIEAASRLIPARNDG